MFGSDDEKSEAAERKARRSQTLRLAAIGVVVVVFSAVALDNRQEVTIGWVLDDVRLPLVVVLVASFIAGLAIGALVGRRSTH